MPLRLEALEDLYRRFAPLVHARVRRIVGADAEDLVQDLFIRLLHSAPDPDKTASWIYTTSTRLAIDRLRHRARRDSGWEHEVRATLEGADDVETLLTRGDLSRKVLAVLDPKTQEAVVAVYFDELTQEEAAAELGVSRKTINERLRRFEEEGRRMVKKWRT